ncbi:hypothetical protein AMR72_15760 [Flavobacterium psychrophilum]|nr:hypothetical protein AMR72_15760 [Flavobacterium psychrophilum]AOE53834.1 hypothetical protein ALW18_15750 [Flavobacterium psychrophilum]
MKKITILLTRILPLVALALLIGCSDDDNKSTDIIVGTWLYTGDLEVATQQFEAEDTTCYKELTTFNKNNSGTIVAQDCEGDSGTITFSWKKESAANIYTVSATNEDNQIESQQLIITFEGKTKMFITYSDDNSYLEVYEKQ